MSQSSSSSDATSSSSSIAAPPRRIIVPTHQLPIDTVLTYNRTLYLLHNAPLSSLTSEISKVLRATSPGLHTQSEYLLQIISVSRYFNARDLTYPSPTSLCNGKNHLVNVPNPDISEPISYVRGSISGIMLSPTVCCITLFYSLVKTLTFKIELNVIMTYFMLLGTCQLKPIRKPEKCPSQRNILQYVIDTLYDVFSTFVPFPDGSFYFLDMPLPVLRRFSSSTIHDRYATPLFCSMFQCLETIIGISPLRTLFRIIFEPNETHLLSWTSFHNGDRRTFSEIFNFEMRISIMIPNQSDIDSLFLPGCLHSFFSNLVSLPDSLQILCYDYLMQHLLSRCDFHYEFSDPDFKKMTFKPVLIPTLWQAYSSQSFSSSRSLFYTLILDRASLRTDNASSSELPAFISSPALGSISHVPTLRDLKHILGTDPLDDSACDLDLAHRHIVSPRGLDPLPSPCGIAQPSQCYDCLTPLIRLTEQDEPESSTANQQRRRFRHTTRLQIVTI
jgi:hypothetical protein